jgi:hypothetical protein
MEVWKYSGKMQMKLYAKTYFLGFVLKMATRSLWEIRVAMKIIIPK